MAVMKMMMLCAVLFMLHVQFSTAGDKDDNYYKAQCMIGADTGISDEPVQGTVEFKQKMGDDKVTITVSLSGFDTEDDDTLHGFHVHADSDMSSQCTGMGGHFNPAGVNHGAPTDDVRHVGDLGNIEEDGEGNVNVVMTDKVISLYGENSIIGKGIVVHEGEDDLGVNTDDDGSITTGNAGGRLGCCVIQLIQDPTAYMAQCSVDASSGLSAEPVEGTVVFSQPTDSDVVTISLDLSGFNMLDSNLLHGFHVHQNGDMGNLCVSMGGHFNPYGTNHGAPDAEERHVGDLGNIEENAMGRVITTFTDDKISLLPGSNSSILGRGIVVHQGEDDLGVNTNDDGSITTGNAGGRIACCIIQTVDTPVAALISPATTAFTSTSLLTVTLLSLLAYLIHH